MHVVITGATGNVGTSLVETLAGEPSVTTVTGVARRLPAWGAPKASWVAADIATDDLRPVFRGADAVVHLAWLFHPMRDATVTGRVNIDGSMRVFDAAAEAGAGALVHASSVGAYSPGPKDRLVDERWPTNGWPTAAYSREKAYVERILDGFAAHHPAMRVVRMRPAFIFKRESASQQRRLFGGPFVPAALLRPRLVPALPTFPELRFQALHSMDAADAFRLALLRDVRGPFNLAAEPVIDGDTLAALLDARPRELSLRVVRAALAAAFRMRAVPVAPELLDAFARIPLLDATRARRELGWRPRHRATEALAALIAGMREGAGLPTPPLDPRAGGVLRVRELTTGVGARA